MARWGRGPSGSTCTCRSARVRCGYCDFNTYTAEELGRRAPRRATYAEAGDRRAPARPPRAGRRGPAGRARSSSAAGRPPCCRRPTSLRCWPRSTAEFGLVAGAEVTTEANPDSVDRGRTWSGCARAGFTRISFGMQSAVRTCWPCWTAPTTRSGSRRSSRGRAQAGFEQVSLDLIYGTPGESLADWEASLDAALAAGRTTCRRTRSSSRPAPRWPARVRRGELPMPDDDDLADKYLAGRRAAHRGGLGWYEVSNWARTTPPAAGTTSSTGPAATGGGRPGAHSHVGGVRWWNVKHPAAYADRLAAGVSPTHAREVLEPSSRAGRAGPARGCGCATGSTAQCSTTSAGPPCRTWWSGGCSTSPRAGWCSTRAAGCSPTPWCATCCP